MTSELVASLPGRSPHGLSSRLDRGIKIRERRTSVRLAVFIGWVVLVPAGPGIAAETDSDFQRIVEQTEQVRNLRFKEPVSFQRLTKEDLAGLLKRELSRQYSGEDWRLMQESLVLLGAIPRGFVLDDFFFDLMAEQIAGLYDPRSKAMYVVGNLPLKVGVTQIILEHELTHALTDQHFDLLGLPIEETRQDDTMLAALALVEGDATLSMAEFAKFLDLKSAVASLVVALFMNPERFEAAPAFYQAWLMFPYLGGEVFLLDLMAGYRVNEDGTELLPRGTDDPRNDLPDWSVVNFLYRRPPVSTEQILHPEKYAAGEKPVPVQIEENLLVDIGEGWNWKWENTLGEFLIETLLGNHLWPYQANRASEGWGGDRYGLAENSEGKRVLYWKTLWDTEEDALEFRNACLKLIEKGTFGGTAILEPSVSEKPREVTLWVASDPTVAERIEGTGGS